MSACPVMQDLDRYMAEIDEADRFDNMVETIKGEYSAFDAAEIIDDYFADTGGDALIAILGEIATADAVAKVAAVVKLHAALDDILTDAAEATATKRLERADDWDGDE